MSNSPEISSTAPKQPVEKENIEKKEILSYEKDAYIVGDSISVGITTWVNVEKKSVKWGMQTAWMLEQVQKDIATLKSKKVMFVLGGTNDIFSNKKAEDIIANLDKIVTLGKQNGLKVVVGTIPPFSDDTTVVQSALKKLKTTSSERYGEIAKVNSYITSHYDFIDYHTMLVNPSNPNHMDSKFEWKGKARDGIHPYNWYKMMREAQIQKLQHIWENNTLKSPEGNTNIEADIQNSIEGVKKSIITFKKQLGTVFSGNTAMTPEQKSQAERIIAEKERVIIQMENILKELQKSSSAIAVKKWELGVYDSKKNLDKNSVEYRELQNTISDLQKILLELDESQTILLKEFWLLSKGIRINEFLDKKVVDRMQNVSGMEFLKNSKDDRLRKVTIGNITSEDILSGKKSDIEVNFVFNRRFNRSLYMNTTAGMILPDEVRSVTVNWKEYSRNSHYQSGEFFTKQWERLIIHDATKIHINTIIAKDEFSKKFVSRLDPKIFQNETDALILQESERRWVPSMIVKTLFGKELSQVSDIKDKRAILEDLMTEIDRKKGYYFKEFGKNGVDDTNKMTPEFLAYIYNDDQKDYTYVAKNFWYKDEDISRAYSSRVPSTPQYAGTIANDRFANMNIPKEEVERIRKIKVFTPNSQDAITLMRIACQVANISQSWATNPNLHYILGKESAGGKVGILNYTVKWMSLNEFYKRANSSQSDNPIGAKSTASGLGQLLLSNVDKYYPSGRKGIGDPIEEAVWFLKYIQDRYGNPDVARSIYGKTGTFIHGITGKREHKWFREWY